jgi:aldose 1-epimerase
MGFAVRTHKQAGVLGMDATIYTLEEDAGSRAEIWPALGFNCYRWQVLRGLLLYELLYADPQLFGNSRPTRSGIPILFPFPNRIRAGRFSWEGKDYQLPLNDPPLKNAIHGFACRRPWRVVDQGASETGTWVTGAFQGSLDARDCLGLWPADYELRITYRLGHNLLRIEAKVLNPDQTPLPFGLGYHPYFRLPFTSTVQPAECLIQTPAKACWELVENLPTGQRSPLDAARDLNAPRVFTELNLDDVLTDLPSRPAIEEGLLERAALHGAPDDALRVLCSPEFREMIVFTPPHRQAFCVEPYTCTTDAINLQARGLDAGWLVLPPGGHWTGVVEMRI